MVEAYKLGLLNPGKNVKKTRKVKQYDLDGNFIKEWLSMRNVERKFGFKTSAISQCCTNKIKQAYGYIWRYAD